MPQLRFKFSGKEFPVDLLTTVLPLFPKNSPWLTSVGADYELDESFFAPDRRVQDKQRYTLESHNGRWELRYMNGNRASNPFTPEYDQELVPGQADIVLLLESPHKDEYTKDLRPLGPARGSTGRQLQQYLCSHVLPILLHHGLHLDLNRRYALCLVNPIPFQTSLGHVLTKSNRALRDSVWMALWGSCQGDFEQRMADYNPEIIWNACTSVVKKEMRESLQGISAAQFNLTHPSNWNQAFSGLGAGEYLTGMDRVPSYASDETVIDHHLRLNGR